MNDDLSTLLARVSRCFPPDAPITLAPPVAFDEASPRWRGHVRRWFAASNGQADELPFWDAHSLAGVAQALHTAQICDDLRAEPDGYWVQPSWASIASDYAGHHIMLDDDDGRVLSVAHDDDHVVVLAPSPELWLEGLLAGFADGTIVWDDTFGLITKRVVDDVAAHRAEAAARAAAPLSLRQKLLLALYLVVGVGVIGAFIAWLEAGR
jgi:hypothetical protein